MTCWFPCCTAGNRQRSMITGNESAVKRRGVSRALVRWSAPRAQVKAGSRRQVSDARARAGDAPMGADQMAMDERRAERIGRKTKS